MESVWESSRRPNTKIVKKEQYDRARKENLCFNCFEVGHSSAAYPKLGTRGHSRNSTKDGKSLWQLHTI